MLGELKVQSTNGTPGQKYLEREHEELRGALRHILDCCALEGNTVLEEKLLPGFLTRLVQHHEAENVTILIVEPKNSTIHVGLHAELVSITEDILKNSTLDHCLDAPAIESLLVLLDRHIATLDADLFAAMVSQQRS